VHVNVDTASPLTVGRTVMDTRSNAADPNADVAFGADPQLLATLLLDVLGGPLARSASPV
jgi:inosine-uridine nucleoside N-ribohydrolase